MNQVTTSRESQIVCRISSRRRIYELLETSRDSDRASRLVDIVLIALIVISVAAVILESIPTIETAYAEIFYWLEVVTVAIFSIEYLLRLWSSVEETENDGSILARLRIRVRYVFSLSAMIDLLAILPFYLVLFSPSGGLDMRFLRCVRLLRVLKLTRYSNAFDMLATTFRDNIRSLAAAFFVLFIVLLLAATGMYYFERHAQPIAFRSIPDAMWWAVSTLTTVGYGDVTPITVGGKVFGALITIVGVGMVALPTGILASGYSLQSSLHSQRYQREANRALLDGTVDDEEKATLEKLRIDLSLSEHAAEQIMDNERARRPGTETQRLCPHCGRKSS